MSRALLAHLKNINQNRALLRSHFALGLAIKGRRLADHFRFCFQFADQSRDVRDDHASRTFRRFSYFQSLNA